MLGQQQGREGAAHGQGQGGQDGGGLQEVMKQKHQHDVNAENASEHGRAKAAEDLRHALRVAGGGAPDTGGQVLNRRQSLHVR